MSWCSAHGKEDMERSAGHHQHDALLSCMACAAVKHVLALSAFST